MKAISLQDKKAYLIKKTNLKLYSKELNNKTKAKQNVYN